MSNTITKSLGTFSGSEEVDKALMELEKKFKKRAIKKAMTRTVALLRKEARKRTPRKTNKLRKSIISKANFRRTREAGVKGHGKTDRIVGSVFYRRDKPKWLGYHANLVEFGTKNRVVENFMGLDSVSVKVGSTKGVHMQRKTKRANRNKIKSIFKNELKSAINTMKIKQIQAG